MENKNFKVDNKIIAKNTVFLYLRMFVLLVVSLYTSRLILQALGVDDYGIYNVVGGIIALFAIIRESINDTTIRFMTYEIGSSGACFQEIFSMSLLIQSALSIIIIVIAEALGLWFLYHVLVIPEDRMTSAFWCFQFSIITFVLRMLSLPFDAAIISHERMSAFAYLSIIDSMGQLVIAQLINVSNSDRLVLYAGLIALLAFIIRMVFAFYCKTYIEGCKFMSKVNRKLFRKMFSFAGWSLIGGASWQLMTSGIEFLVNIYYGVAVNAARAIASQVSSGVSLLVNNFSRALDPQIIKVHASGDRNELFNLVFRGARISYYLLLIIAIPVIFETEIIMKIWLVKVPAYAVIFVRLSVISNMISAVSKTQVTAAQATGDIKKYQIVVSGIGLLVFPIAWCFLWLGYSPEFTYISVIIVYLIQFVARLILLKNQISLPVGVYINDVLIKVFITSFFALIPIGFICLLYEKSIYRLLSVIVVSFISSLLSIFFFGLTKIERHGIACLISKRI